MTTRRHETAPLPLRTRVTFRPAGHFAMQGEIRARTREPRPRYDILGDDGQWYTSIPADKVEVEKGEAA